MLDFTSASYLGLRHGTDSLRGWAQLTTGVPAALREPPEAKRVAADLAALAGVERATLARSTLHAFWDLFLVEDREPRQIFVDAAAYPVARWGAERAAWRGGALRTFRHHDPDGLRRLLHCADGRRGRPWILTDGYCTGCGSMAPLAEYATIARQTEGRLVIDDTQAFGIFGQHPHHGAPYGYGGGGSLRATATSGRDVMVVASLAKGFGVPLTVVGGSRRAIEQFEAGSETRVHNSPPSFADLHAAEHALDINRRLGEVIRQRLASLVVRFRRGLRRLRLTPDPSLFPLQGLRGMASFTARMLHDRLRNLGVDVVLRRTTCAATQELAFLITAAHVATEIDQLVRALSRACASQT